MITTLPDPISVKMIHCEGYVQLRFNKGDCLEQTYHTGSTPGIQTYAKQIIYTNDNSALRGACHQLGYDMSDVKTSTAEWYAQIVSPHCLLFPLQRLPSISSAGMLNEYTCHGILLVRPPQ